MNIACILTLALYRKVQRSRLDEMLLSMSNENTRQKEEIFARPRAHRRMMALAETCTRSIRLQEPLNIPKDYAACVEASGG